MIDILHKDIFDVVAHMYVIPFSTEGTISETFRIGLRDLNTDSFDWKIRPSTLGSVRVNPIQTENRYIAFACTVNGNESAYHAIRSIAQGLAQYVVDNPDLQIKTIATPILGTGAGNLSPIRSIKIMQEAFKEITKDASLLFCTNNQKYYESLRSNNTISVAEGLTSAQLVIESELKRIMNDEYLTRIQYDEKFFFELAKEKYEEFLSYQSGSEYFYQNLYDKSKNSKLTFRAFYDSGLTEKEHEFVTLCGELIAYIDYRAYHKNIWNKTPDKRVLAQSAVRQNDWFRNLIRFKITHNLSSVSSSIRAALSYLENPDENLTMLSATHRERLRKYLFGNPPKYLSIEDLVVSMFRNFGITTSNYINFTAFCSRILYHPLVAPIWNEKVTTFTLAGVPKEREIGLGYAAKLVENCLKLKSATLDLGNCGLTDLNDLHEVFECTHIETLILSNEWAEFKDGFWEPRKSSNPKHLPNNFTQLPDEIEKLSNLKHLICGGDWNRGRKEPWNRWGISSLYSISKLTNLETLNISNNEIKSLQGLNKLVKLKYAHLNNNKIIKTADLSRLINLRELNLSNNLIADVTFLSELKGLQTIDLHRNEIKNLTPIIDLIANLEIKNSKWKPNAINIANNPLEYPPMQVVDSGSDAVLGFFNDINKRGEYVNKSVKVILIGNSEVGKSTMLKYLDNEKDLDQQHYATLWMEEKTITSKHINRKLGTKCELRVFDFGGHDYFHDTHHIFYDTNTIYLLLWDIATKKFNPERTVTQRTKNNLEVEITTQDYPVTYWLDSVKFHTQGVKADNFAFELDNLLENDTVSDNGTKLLIIQNKVSDPSQIDFLQIPDLQNDYPFVIDTINLSIINQPRNLLHFDNLLQEILDSMQLIGTVLPNTYKIIKDNIATYEGPPILSFDAFRNYCNTLVDGTGLDESECRRLVGYLKRVGIILYTGVADQEKIFIDKSWVTEKMYLILQDLKEEDGEFDRDYVKRLLGENEKDIDDLLFIMQEFKIIFKHPALNKYIAPLYLRKSPEDKVKLFLNKSHKPYRRFDYVGYIQKNVILEIFAHFGTLFELKEHQDIFYYWKDGLVIKNPQTEEIAMITFNLDKDKANGYIDIYDITHSPIGEPKFIKDVHQYILEVSKGYKIEEMVTINGDDFVSTKVLEKNVSLGKYIFSEKKYKDFDDEKEEKKHFNLKDFIDMNFVKNNIEKKKVVISYSQYDIEHLHNLERYLQPLVLHELIDKPWSCECLITSEPWDQKIKKQFDEADIIIFLVSSNLMSTKYVTENEITCAIDRYDADNSSVKIVPIVLDPYDWRGKGKYDLQRFSAMPFKGKAITDFHSQNIAWHTITHAIRIMIEHDISPESSGAPSREIEKLYERQVAGKLDNNAN